MIEHMMPNEPLTAREVFEAAIDDVLADLEAAKEAGASDIEIAFILPRLKLAIQMLEKIEGFKGGGF